MQKRNSVLIAGVISILILTSIQIFIIKGIWNQKDELFALRYTIRSQEALNSMTMKMSTDGFDTVRFLLGNYSEKANKQLHAIKEQEEFAAKKKEALKYFEKAVNQEQDLSTMLSFYFDKRGWDKNFKVTIEILNLEMISNDTIIIFQSEGFTKRRVAEHSEKTTSQKILKDRILVNWFRMEDNNYRFLFGYYIDFSDKQKVILKESLATLSLSIFSIIVVIIIFITAYRNLMEEKRLSNLKTDFINNMTHELKTPLSTITVAGKTLEMEQIRANDQKILETAKLIGKQSIHLNQLINMILEISMWERTQFELEKKTIDIKELMNDITDSFKTGCGNGTTISQRYNFNDVNVNLDVVYFTTLINNLLSNAVKYSDKDPVIDIEGFKTENTIYIKVTDNGIGINKADQKHIFDKFYRASTGNIHKFKGLGLGLYYVKRIAEAHGGDVSVVSKPGKGSTFTVTIPDNL